MTKSIKPVLLLICVGVLAIEGHAMAKISWGLLGFALTDSAPSVLPPAPVPESPELYKQLQIRNYLNERTKVFESGIKEWEVAQADDESYTEKHEAYVIGFVTLYRLYEDFLKQYPNFQADISDFYHNACRSLLYRKGQIVVSCCMGNPEDSCLKLDPANCAHEGIWRDTVLICDSLPTNSSFALAEPSPKYRFTSMAPVKAPRAKSLARREEKMALNETQILEFISQLKKPPLNQASDLYVQYREFEIYFEDVNMYKSGYALKYLVNGSDREYRNEFKGTMVWAFWIMQYQQEMRDKFPNFQKDIQMYFEKIHCNKELRQQIRNIYFAIHEWCMNNRHIEECDVIGCAYEVNYQLDEDEFKCGQILPPFLERSLRQEWRYNATKKLAD